MLQLVVLAALRVELETFLKQSRKLEHISNTTLEAIITRMRQVSFLSYIIHKQIILAPAMLSLVEGLRSSNEIRQSEAASELAEMLLLGNEESLPNMPIVEIVQALCALLQKDNNYDLVTHLFLIK